MQAPATFDPSTYTGPLEALTPEQHQQVLEYRRQKYKADLDAKKAAHPAPAPHLRPAGEPQLTLAAALPARRA